MENIINHGNNKSLTLGRIEIQISPTVYKDEEGSYRHTTQKVTHTIKIKKNKKTNENSKRTKTFIKTIFITT